MDEGKNLADRSIRHLQNSSQNKTIIHVTTEGLQDLQRILKNQSKDVARLGIEGIKFLRESIEKKEKKLQDKALELFLKAQRIEPDNQILLFIIGTIHLANQKNGKANAYLQRVKIPNQNTAMIYQENGDLDKAINCFKQISGYGPQQSSFFLNVSLSLKKTGDQRQSQLCLEQAVNKANLLALINRGVNYYHQHEYEKAIQSFGQIAKYSPDSKIKAIAEMNLGRVYAQLKQYDKAIIHDRISLQLDENSADTIFSLGCAHANSDSLVQAEQYLNKALNLSPKNPEFQERLGKFYADQGKYQDAIAPLRNALQLKPNTFQCHHNLALALFKTKQFKEALKEYEAAARFKKGYYRGRYYMGLCHVGMKQYQRAIDCFHDQICCYDQKQKNEYIEQPFSMLFHCHNQLKKSKQNDISQKQTVQLDLQKGEQIFQISQDFENLSKLFDLLFQKYQGWMEYIIDRKELFSIQILKKYFIQGIKKKIILKDDLSIVGLYKLARFLSTNKESNSVENAVLNFIDRIAIAEGDTQAFVIFKIALFYLYLGRFSDYKKYFNRLSDIQSKMPEKKQTITIKKYQDSITHLKPYLGEINIIKLIVEAQLCIELKFQKPKNVRPKRIQQTKSTNSKYKKYFRKRNLDKNQAKARNNLEQPSQQENQQQSKKTSSQVKQQNSEIINTSNINQSSQEKSSTEQKSQMTIYKSIHQKQSQIAQSSQQYTCNKDKDTFFNKFEDKKMAQKVGPMLFNHFAFIIQYLQENAEKFIHIPHHYKKPQYTKPKTKGQKAKLQKFQLKVQKGIPFRDNYMKQKQFYDVCETVEDALLRITCLIEGILQLQKNNIYHADLTNKNIIKIKKDGEYSYKIIDFDWAFKVASSSKRNQLQDDLESSLREIIQYWLEEDKSNCTKSDDFILCRLFKQIKSDTQKQSELLNLRKSDQMPLDDKINKIMDLQKQWMFKSHKQQFQLHVGLLIDSGHLKNNDQLMKGIDESMQNNINNQKYMQFLTIVQDLIRKSEKKSK